MVRARGAAAALLLAVVLAGCGGERPGGTSGASGAAAPPTSGVPTAGHTPTPAVGPGQAGPGGEASLSGSPAAGEPSDGTGGGDPSGDDPFADVVVLAEPMQFTTPSGNISCALDVGYARCDILERDWEPPPPPEDCDVDFGQGLEVDDTGAGLVCAGDTVLGATQTLPYGEAVQGGRVACASQRSGVRCEHLDTGAGFVLSRASYEVY